MKMIRAAIVNIFLFIYYRIIGFLFRLLPIQNNKIVCVSFFGKGYGDNPKYIVEELIKSASIPLKIVWLIKGKVDSDFPKQIQVVKRGSLSELYHLSTAKIWIDNSRKHFGVKKRKQQYYLQTWHGSIGFKLFEKDINPDIWYKASAKNDSKMIDALISSSRWQTDSYKRCFWYDGRILEIGVPKNDFWADAVRKETCIKKSVYKAFQLNEERKIVLYAPTFRDGNSLSAYDMDYEKLICNLEKYWGGEWIIMIRLHPHIEDKAKNIVYTKKVVNASRYPDINELLLASSLLITDYSSCLFDAVYIEKPSIVYASDIEKYRKERGFAIPLTESPAMLAENNNELRRAIKEFNLMQYIKKCQDFSKKYGIIHRSDASKISAEWILNHIS